MLEDLEDYRAATIVTSIDYSKAFNRMSYQHCLASLTKNGASTEVLRLVATFLTNRTMMVKVGSIMSDSLPVSGGCPQGSILGIFLFNATIDDLEEGCPDLGNESGEAAAIGDTDSSSDSSETAKRSDSESSPDESSHTEIVSSVWNGCSTPNHRRLRAHPISAASPILGLHGVSQREALRLKRNRRRPARLNYSGELRLDIPVEKKPQD